MFFLRTSACVQPIYSELGRVMFRYGKSDVWLYKKILFVLFGYVKRCHLARCV
jgi:hypothetical protein